MKAHFLFLLAGCSMVAMGFRSIATDVTGMPFPELSGTTLADQHVTIPVDTKGKSTIIALAYSQDAEEELKTWAEPAYDKFVAKNEVMPYDVNLYFVPMFSGAKAAMAESAREKFKKQNDPQLYPYVLIYKGEIDQYRSVLKMEKKNTPYIFVLDGTGKIVYATSGVYTEAKMDEIEDHLE
jgi:hypothetical protein